MEEGVREGGFSGAGFGVARWAGRGDQQRGIVVLALAASAASFVTLFLPWIGFAGHDQSGWSVPLGTDYGLLALAVVLVELLSLSRAWTTRGSELVAFCLTAAAGLIGVSAVANMRWGFFAPIVAIYAYGAWIGLVLSIALLLFAALRLLVLWRPVP